MKSLRHPLWFLANSAALLCCLCFVVRAEPINLKVRANQPGPQLNPNMWGIFFEDINFGADGGLYAELVKNRGFEFPDTLMGWHQIDGDNGAIEARTQAPIHPANAHYVRLQSAGHRKAGIVNEGFRGMGIRAHESYEFTAQVRAAGGTPALRIELIDPQERVLASSRIASISSEWKSHKAILRPKTTEAKAHLRILIDSPGAIDIDMVSLFPKKTWKNRANGLRPDLIQMLADLKPGFMRFPGGCIVEGRDLSLRYQWKTTIGPVEQRTLITNRWNDEFKHRPTPDYFQSFGLGFFEFFQLCEDIGTEPLPILNCGMACQFNTGQLVPLEKLNPFIQDALDLIQFASGSASTPWGSRRAALGHPKPFNMKLLGVGNEQWGPQYIERYERFASALKTRHPDIKLISSAGPRPDDDLFQFLWPRLRELKADIVDEHCYATPDWFLNNASRYNNYDRHGPKVFMGEYAAQSVKTVSPDNRNDWGCALAEAAYMVGLERNGDVVVMASYAPLLAHLDAWQWTPNLIWFDNLNVYGTPSYYVQKLFSRNRGDRLLPLQIASGSSTATDLSRFYASATLDEASREVILKLVNATSLPIETVLDLEGTALSSSRIKTEVLASPQLNDENSIQNPRKVYPAAGFIKVTDSKFSYTCAPNSMTVLRIPCHIRL